MRKLVFVLLFSVFLISSAPVAFGAALSYAQCGPCILNGGVWRYCVGDKTNGWCQDTKSGCGIWDWTHWCGTDCICNDCSQKSCGITCSDYKTKSTCDAAYLEDGSGCCWITGKNEDEITVSECVGEDDCGKEICGSLYCSAQEDCCFWEDPDIGTKYHGCYNPTTQQCTASGIISLCVGKAPIVSNTPSGFDIKVGTVAASYKVDFSLKNDDSVQCSKSTFYLSFPTGGCPSGWTCRFDNGLTTRTVSLLSPQTTASFYINVCPPSILSAGTYQVKVKTTRGTNEVVNTITFTAEESVCGDGERDIGESCDPGSKDPNDPNYGKISEVNYKSCLNPIGEETYCDYTNRQYGERDTYGNCINCKCVIDDYKWYTDSRYCTNCEHCGDGTVQSICGEDCEKGTTKTCTKSCTYKKCDANKQCVSVTENIGGTISCLNDCKWSTECKATCPQNVCEDNTDCEEPTCTCTAWENKGCGVSPCLITQMKKTKTCTPPGCDEEVSCPEDPSCGAVVEKGNFRIDLYGDYDLSNEYCRVSIEGDNMADVCSGENSGCGQCSLNKKAYLADIDVSKYCGDKELKVDFYDSVAASDTSCGLYEAYYINHKACIEVQGTWHCCEKKCGTNGCGNSVIFDCDDWSCIDGTYSSEDVCNIVKGKCGGPTGIGCDQAVCKIALEGPKTSGYLTGCLNMYDDKFFEVVVASPQYAVEITLTNNGEYCNKNDLLVYESCSRDPIYKDETSAYVKSWTWPGKVSILPQTLIVGIRGDESTNKNCKWTLEAKYVEAPPPTLPTKKEITIYQGVNIVGIAGLHQDDFSNCGLVYYESSTRLGCKYDDNGYFVYYNPLGENKGDCYSNFFSSANMAGGLGYYLYAAKQCVISFNVPAYVEVKLHPGANIISVPAETTLDDIAKICGDKTKIFTYYISSTKAGCSYDDRGYFVYYDAGGSADGDCGSRFKSDYRLRPYVGYYVYFNGRDGDNVTACTLKYEDEQFVPLP